MNDYLIISIAIFVILGVMYIIYRQMCNVEEWNIHDPERAEKTKMVRGNKDG